MMRVSSLPRFWVTTFSGRPREKPTALDGVYSVFFSSLILSLVSLLLKTAQTRTADVMSIIIYLIIVPVVALGLVFVFVLLVRVASGLFGGKAGLVKELQAVAPTAGSLIFAAGIATVLLFQVSSWLYSPDYAQILASPTNYFIIQGIIFGIIAAQALFFTNTAYGVWLENLAEAEKTHDSHKILALACALIIFAVIVAGFYLIGLSVEDQLNAIRSQLGSQLTA